MTTPPSTRDTTNQAASVTPTTATTTAGPRVLLRVEDAAHRLAIGRTSIFALIRSGAIRSVRVGRLRRIPADALTDYIHHLTTTQHHSAA